VAHTQLEPYLGFLTCFSGHRTRFLVTPLTQSIP